MVGALAYVCLSVCSDCVVKDECGFGTRTVELLVVFVLAMSLSGLILVACTTADGDAHSAPFEETVVRPWVSLMVVESIETATR